DQQITINYSKASIATIEVSLSKEPAPLVMEMPLTVDFKHKENEYYDFYRESLVPFLASREGPALATGDVNSDGLDDFYVGGAKHQAGVIYLQKENGSFIDSPQRNFEEEKIFEDVDAAFADVDNDGDLDLYVASGGNEFYNTMPQQSDRLYINDGSGHFARDTDALPLLLQNKSCVRPTDIDNDGDIDFFVGGRVVPFQYGKPARSFILINDGHGKFSDETKRTNATFSSLGMVTDAQWGDFDGDGDPDLAIAGEWMPVRVFLNDKGLLTEMKNMLSSSSPIRNIAGLWQCVNLTDFDRDGDLDIVAGNLGLNSALKINDSTRIRLMVGVSRDDGKKESLMARMEKDGRYYPVPGWLTLGNVFPERFSNEYPIAAKYDGVDLEDLVHALELEWDAELNVNQLASLLFENKNGKEFIVRMLPDEIQYSSIYAIEFGDINGDEYPDLIAGGNTLNVSPDQGAYMASIGLIAIGDQKGFFETKSPRQSGLWVAGEVRNIKTIRVNGRPAWLIARNNDALKLFQSVKQVAYVQK
ncbi:MAG TPA: VCBS repeat-containing protein, partial [Chryseosolibacter sp.]